jgi:hypothetical protein
VDSVVRVDIVAGVGVEEGMLAVVG